jgi:uncharacterized membrane protein YccC
VTTPLIQRLHTWTLNHANPFHWREAGLCVPALPLILIAGVLLHQPLYGAAAAGAAFAVGFGAARDLRGWRWAAMGGAAIGVALATFVGCTLGQWPPALIAVAALAAAGCAAFALFDEDFWWVTLQALIALLIASYYPSPAPAALARAGAVLAGGVTQMVVIVLLAHLFPTAGGRLPPGSAQPRPERRVLIGHILRAAVCVAAALTAARALGLSNGYWAPMTAMLVLKPGLSDTQVRGLSRLVGTLIGCIAASAFVIATHEARPALLAAMAVTSGLAYALQKAHYATLTCVITATVVLLLTLGGGNVVISAEHRLIATVLGGVIAIVAARIAPHRPQARSAPEDRVGGAA